MSVRNKADLVKLLEGLAPSDAHVTEAIEEAVAFIRAEEEEELNRVTWKEKNSDANLAKGWRGRRFVACRAQRAMETVIENLAVDNGSNLPPAGGLPVVTPQAINELRNLSAVLLRMVLVANDGSMSATSLNTF